MPVFTRFILGAAGAWLLAQSALAAPFANGSFEAAGGAPIREILQPANGNLIAPWVHEGSGTEVYQSSNQDNLMAADGTYYVSFGHNGSTGGRLVQTFDTTPGLRYRVNYKIAPQQGLAVGQAMQVSAADAAHPETPLAQVRNDISGSSYDWVEGQVLEFTATSASTRLVFTDETPTTSPGSSAANWGLDDVRVLASGNTLTVLDALPSGSAVNYSLSATLRFGLADQGKDWQVFVAVVLPNGLVLFKTDANWALAGATPPWPAAYTIRQADDHTYVVPIVTNADLSSVPGTLVYVGYGVDAQDMWSHARYKLIAIVPAP